MADDKKSDDQKVDDKAAKKTALTDDTDKSGDQKGADKKADDQQADDKKAGDQKADEGTKKGASDDGTDKGGKKGDDQKVEDKPKAPDKYQLAFPEEGLFTESDTQRYEQLGKTLGLSQQQLQSIVDADVQALDDLTDAYLRETKADKELGGKQFESAVALARKGLDAAIKGAQLTDDEADFVKFAFEKSGVGNHKAFIRMFRWLGKQASEDDGASGKSGGGGEKTAAQMFYGTD